MRTKDYIWIGGGAGGATQMGHGLGMPAYARVYASQLFLPILPPVSCSENIKFERSLGLHGQVSG
jgi:hypothetical protein